MSDCEATREQLLDAVRGRLAGPERQRFERHLECCPECHRLFKRERELERLLGQRPNHALPAALAARLAQQAPQQQQPKARFRRIAAILTPSVAAVLLALLLVRGRLPPSRQLVDEAVNDHLRVLYAEHPIEIESGGIHQVKPWFAGRLDFAPTLSFSGDEEFPLQGGAVGLFVDRKAATFVFKHRLHTASLFVFRSDGLTWPLRNDASLGAAPAASATARGFNLLFWREGDLGYALVSDMDQGNLARLANKLAQP